MANNLISVGSGREAAFAAALLGDNVLMEKAWQETGMLAEAVLHAHVFYSTYLPTNQLLLFNSLTFDVVAFTY